MTLFEHIRRLDPLNKTVYLNEQEQIVIHRKEFDEIKDNDDNYIGIVAAAIAIDKIIFPDKRHISPGKISIEVLVQHPNIITFPGGLMHQLKTIEVAEDAEIAYDRIHLDRKPYYRIRGKPVTPAQAMDMIRRTDDVFRHIGPEARASDAVDTWLFENSWLITKRAHTPGFGWVHPDGLIGINAITLDKNPEHFSFFRQALEYKLAFPCLDMVIAVTDWNEQPDYAWEDCEYTEADDSSFYDFLEHVVYGLWLHDDKIEIMGPSKARAVYQEYVKLYGIEDTSRYVRPWKRQEEYDQEQYSRQCYKANGADAEAIFNE